MDGCLLPFALEATTKTEAKTDRTSRDPASFDIVAFANSLRYRLPTMPVNS